MYIKNYSICMFRFQVTDIEILTSVTNNMRPSLETEALMNVACDKYGPWTAIQEKDPFSTSWDVLSMCQPHNFIDQQYLTCDVVNIA